MSRELRELEKKEKLIPMAHDVAPTNYSGIVPNRIVPPSDYDDNQKRFVKLITEVSPLILAHPVTVRIFTDKRAEFEGCTCWLKNGYIFNINLAHHNTDNWVENYELFIHELAHHKLQTNDHLDRIFYDSVTEIGAKLAQLAVMRPRRFKGTSEPFKAMKVLEHSQEVAADR